ncbi:HEPN domain-containing protein [Candidatus Gottesmanbacteria bacterium]|nr:HEPN domain-containing protein [Candidatus Gottesmanbacteria bacterium]
MDDHKKILANEWFDAAVSDYHYAEVGLREERIYPQIGFLSQQVAEKFLKGFLILHGIEPPRIHELPTLLDYCVKINSEFENLRDACELLTGFYVESRYPPDQPDYSKEEIVEAFRNARLIKETIEKVSHV